MADKLASPGVFTEINDQTFLPQGAGTTSGAFVGPTEKGPAFTPVTVTSPQEYIETFGRGGYYTDFSVLNYLSDAGSATVVRILGGSPSAVDEGVAGYVNDIFEIRESTASDLGSSDSVQAAENDVLALLAPTGNAPDDIASNITLTGTGTFDEFDLEIGAAPDTKTYRISLNPSKKNYITKIFGTQPDGIREVYVLSNFFELHEEIRDNSLTSIDVELNVRAQTLDFDNQGFKEAETPWVVSQDLMEEQPFMEEKVQLFKFFTLADGNSSNRDVKVSIQNVRPADEVANSEYGLFDVVVRDFNDTDLNPDVLETYTDLSINPDAANYIVRVIGNRNRIFEADGGIKTEGEYQNNSDYVRVVINDSVERANENGRNDQADLVPWGFAGYSFPYQIDDSSILPHGLKVRENQSRVDAEYEARDTGDWVQTGPPGERTDSRIHYGFDFTYNSNLNFLNPVQNGIDVEDVKNVSTSFNFSDTIGYDSSQDFDSFDQTELNQRKFTVGFQGGFDGKDISATLNQGEDITATNTQGLDCSTFSSNGTLGYFDAMNILSNKELFNINLLTTPGIQQNLHPAVVEAGINLVEAREDVFYILDVVGPNESVSQATQAASDLDSKFAATYYPWLRAVDNQTNKIVSLPPSALMPRVYAFSDQIQDPWFAPAGLQRGGIPEAREAVKTLVKADRDELYQSNVNPINSYSNQGVIAFGQKTLQSLESATDRINVVRLLITATKFITETGRGFVYEQNTQATRDEFKSLVNPFLSRIQQRSGLQRFEVQMDSDNNPPEVIDRNILVGDIYLVPTRSIEFIQLTFNLTESGVEFGQ